MPSKSEKGRKGAPVVYSLEAHREFVQGFRKRKQARRQKAKADLEAAEKQARRDVRRQKRELVRSNREKVLDHHSDSDSDHEQNGDVTQVTTFAGEGDSVVTAVVAPMEMNCFEAPQSRKRINQDEKKSNDASEKCAQDRDNDGREAGVAKSKKRLGVVETLRKHRKRRVSYTHAMSKANRRKKKIKMRREANKS